MDSLSRKYIKAMNYNHQSSYDRELQRHLDAYHLGLSADLSLIQSLDAGIVINVLTYLLELACQAQNIRNIELGREALLSLPREWLLERIEMASKPLLELNEEWEYRRLMEIYLSLDNQLARKLVNLGLNSSNHDVNDAATDYLMHGRMS